MTTHQLELRPIDKLRSESFFVPRYQRGYRWTDLQVVDLLEDVWDFVRDKKKSKEEFYCLQPVVVARHEDAAWEVVDGQQRLTTLFLILSYFNSRFVPEHRKKLYSISYETRSGSAEFLLEPQSSRADENIDFFHISAAREAIRLWFEDKTAHINDVESAFLLDVKVIWYELEPKARPVEVFQRLNIGKIPLTEDELVKALFLRAANFVGEDSRLLNLRQMQIAHEWDLMERRLQEDEFWYFLTNQRRESNRIVFLLELHATSIKRSDGQPWRGLDIFHIFSQRLSETDVFAWVEWQQVKRIFSLLEEWFRDDTLHHLVGFLATRESVDPHASIKTVLQMASKAANKRDFRQALKKEIFSRIFYRGQARNDEIPAAELPGYIRQEVRELQYGSDSAAIRSVLLLFNLASLLESASGTRFPFGAFKREAWDIEHIRSVQSDMPLRVDEQKGWLNTFVDYLGGLVRLDSSVQDFQDQGAREFIEKAQTLLKTEKFDSESFAAYFKRVQQNYDPRQNPETDDSIGNLTLLDSTTNRGYGNAIFPVKRSKIIALDKAGRFVPLCTKNAFLKYYSRHVDQMLVWNDADAQAYANAICDRLITFFTKENPQ